MSATRRTTCWRSLVFPQVDWQQISSTNLRVRGNKELQTTHRHRRRLPHPEALLGLAGAALVEQHDEWAAADRRYFSERSMTRVTYIRTMRSDMTKTWFITGASRGLGAATANAALAAGARVVATSRRAASAADSVHGPDDRLLVLPLDVTQPDSVRSAVDAAIQRFGRIDVLVNNAGYGQLGVFEQTTAQEVTAQYETNVFGLMDVSRVIVPLMREQRSGHIINISSVGGLKGVFGGSVYNASKFAVEGFSQALAEEMAPFGVHVTCVAPGFFRTDFLDPSSAAYTDNEIPDYSDALAAFLDFHHDRNQNQAGDPDLFGDLLVHLTTLDNPPISFVAGTDAIQWATSAAKDRLASLAEWSALSASTDGAWPGQH